MSDSVAATRAAPVLQRVASLIDPIERGGLVAGPPNSVLRYRLLAVASVSVMLLALTGRSHTRAARAQIGSQRRSKYLFSHRICPKIASHFSADALTTICSTELPAT